MYKAKINDLYSFSIEAGENSFMLDGEEKAVDLQQVDERTFQVLYEGRSFTVHLMENNAAERTISLKINGKVAQVELSSELDQLLERMGLSQLASGAAADVKAPMPGLIHSVIAQPGQEVKKGDPLLILEAMKMENVIKSPADGTVAKIPVEQGQNVEKGALLVAFA